MKQIFTLLVCACTCSLGAQITFQETYGTSLGFEYSLSSVQVSSCGYISMGNSDSGAFGGLDYMLLRTDDYGVEQWRRYYGTTAPEIATGIIETNDGGFAFCGGWHGLGNDSATLIKTDAGGNIQWQRTFLPLPGRAICQDLVQTSDGGYVVAGFCGTNALQGFVVRFSTAGNMVWQKTYGGTAHEEFIAIAEVNGNGFVMTGRSDVTGPSDFWLVRIDPSGDTLWTRTYGTGFDEESYDVVTTQDGGFAICGYENMPGGDAMLVKADGTGALQWTKYFDGGSSGWDFSRSLVETWDGGFAIAGRAESSGNYNHMWLIRTDATGTFMWQRIYPRDFFSNGEDLYQTSDLGFLITGYTGNASGDPGNLYLVKTESAGYVGITESAAAHADFVLSTDASAQMLTLRFDSAARGREIRITNMEGKEMLYIREDEMTLEISTAGWASGVYVATVIAGQGVSTRKFVVN